nr:hypothetical protein [Tanacetum cinerariifolium]
MANLSEYIQCAGSDTRPPMLDRTDFASWQQRIHLYCHGKENRVNILKSIDERPFQMGTFRETLAKRNEGALHLGPERARVYTDLSPEQKDRYNDNVKMLLVGSELTKEDRESQLYDDFKHFHPNKGETIHDYYVWFAKLINDMRNIKMTMSRMQLNSKFVNNMLLEWDRFVIAVKLNKALNVDNIFQADDCDAFDSDVDEGPTAQTMFMPNLSSADPVYDEASLSYASDILSENYVIDSDADYTSDSNMISYDQYVKDNAESVVQKENLKKVVDLPKPRPDNPNVQSPLPSTTLAATLITTAFLKITTTTTTLIVTTTTPLLPPLQPLQSTTDTSIESRLDDAFTHIANSVQANLDLEERLRKVKIHDLSSLIEKQMQGCLQIASNLDGRINKHASRLSALENLNISHKIKVAVDEIVTDAVDWAMQAPLRARFSDLHAEEKKKRDLPRTPFGSPLLQPPPPPPPTGAFGAPDVKNNWATALVSTYVPPAENSLLAKTGDMMTFMNWYCQKMEECHKMLTDQINWVNPEDLDHLRYSNKGSRPVLSISKMKAACYPDFVLELLKFYIERHDSPSHRREVQKHMRILNVVRVKAFSRYGYDYLREIVLRRADFQKHKIAEKDFKNLYPSDFEDLNMLLLQGHLDHLPGSDKRMLSTAVKLWTRNLVI